MVDWGFSSVILWIIQIFFMRLIMSSKRKFAVLFKKILFDHFEIEKFGGFNKKV
jgi:hypothetical protein